MQGIEQVIVVDHHVNDVVDVLDARAGLKPRVRWGVDGKVLSKFDQKWVPAMQATGPMQKEQGRTATVGAQLGLKHAVANRERFFFHSDHLFQPGANAASTARQKYVSSSFHRIARENNTFPWPNWRSMCGAQH